MAKKPKLYLRLFLLQLASLVALAAPLAVVLIVNRARYFTETEAAVKLTTGALIAVALLLLSMAGKLRMPRRVVLISLVVVMSWLLEAILKDLFLLSSMVLIGVALDSLLFEPFVKHTRELITLHRGATVQAEATAAAMCKANAGSGRV